jgi:hypothetical protein
MVALLLSSFLITTLNIFTSYVRFNEHDCPSNILSRILVSFLIVVHSAQDNTVMNFAEICMEWSGMK